MEFLVRIEIRYPPDEDPERTTALQARARLRGAELAEAGLIRRMWRVPGRNANVGLWEAPDASTLHDAIASLPFYPWFDVEVIPLASHPSDPGPPG